MTTATNRPLTGKQRAFADSIVAGSNLTDSYRKAYNTENMKASSVHANACQLAADTRITQRIETRRAAQDRAGIACSVSDRELVLTKLRDKLDQGDNDMVQLRAAELLGKTIAMFTDKVIEQSEQRTPEQIKAELQTIMAQVFDKTEKVQLKAVKSA
jgi:phage terminase small subunit